MAVLSIFLVGNTSEIPMGSMEVCAHFSALVAVLQDPQMPSLAMGHDSKQEFRATWPERRDAWKRENQKTEKTRKPRKHAKTRKPRKLRKRRKQENRENEKTEKTEKTKKPRD